MRHYNIYISIYTFKEADSSTLIGLGAATGFLLQYGESETTVMAMTVSKLQNNNLAL